MKTKVFCFLIALIGSLVIFSSCESKSGKIVRDREKAAKTLILKADTLLFSPDKIGVTKLEKEFIPYPKFDGGTGIRMNFFIGIQYQEKTYEVKCPGVKFFRENVTEEKAENDPSISSLVLTHYLVSNTPKDYIDVLVVNAEVIKLTRRATFFADGTFYPTEIIWVKK